jgi:hypothetical protein
MMMMLMRMMMNLMRVMMMMMMMMIIYSLHVIYHRIEIIDLDGACTFLVEHSGHFDALVEELVFELIEEAGSRAGENRDHCALEAAGAGMEFQADKVEVVRGGVVAGCDLARIRAKRDVGFF